MDAVYDLIRRLEAEGVLSSELMPEENYWHWSVEKPELLQNAWLQRVYADCGEIRYYWS